MANRTFAERLRRGFRTTTACRALPLVTALALAAAPGARAQNLLPNGEFDVDTLAWFTAGSGSTIAWTGIDHSGCPPSVSGALLQTNASTAAATARGSAACVTDIVGNATYSFGVDLRFPTGQTRTGSAEVVVVWFETPDCTGLSGSTSSGGPPVSTATAGNWVPVRNDAATAPAEAISASFSVRLLKNEAGGSLALTYDGAFLADGVILLFNDDFERQSSCHWSATIP